MSSLFLTVDLVKYFAVVGQLPLPAPHRSKLLAFGESLVQLSKLLATMPKADASLIAQSATEALRLASTGYLRLYDAAEDQLALTYVAKLVGIEAPAHSLAEGLSALRRAKPSGEGDAWLLGKRRDWDEFVQNIAMETKMRIVKKTRAEVSQEAANAQDEEGLENAHGDDIENGKEVNGFSMKFNQRVTDADQGDSWKVKSAKPDPFGNSTERASNPFGGQNTSSNEGFDSFRGEHFDSIRANVGSTERLEAQVTSQPAKVSAFEQRIPKKQLFDSDSEDEQRPRVSQNLQKTSNDHYTANETSENLLDIGSPVASIEFNELGQAPAFNF